MPVFIADCTCSVTLGKFLEYGTLGSVHIAHDKFKTLVHFLFGSFNIS